MIKTIYAFDVDETLEVSGGPVLIKSLLDLWHDDYIILGLCGNWAHVAKTVQGWWKMFSFIGPMEMDKTNFLRQIKAYISANEYVMVGNIMGVTGSSDDQGAAQRAEWRFLAEHEFAEGKR